MHRFGTFGVFRLLTAVVTALSASTADAGIAAVVAQGLPGADGRIPMYDSRVDPLAAGATKWWAEMGTKDPRPDLLDPDGWAYALADSSAGVLKAAVASPWNRQGSGLASSFVEESFRFSSALPGSFATLHYSFHVELAAGPFGIAEAGQIAYGNFWLDVLGGEHGHQELNYCIGPNADCLHEFAYVEHRVEGQVLIPIDTGQKHIWAHVNLGAQQGNAARAENTARLYLELPEGVTILSDSGVFLSSAQPIPEPSSVAMMVVGLMGLASYRSRRRSPCLSVR